MDDNSCSFIAMYRSLEGPAWRWKLAKRLADSQGRRLPGVDNLIRRTAAYLAICRQEGAGKTRAARRHPDVAAAVRCWNDMGTSGPLGVLAIAGCPQEEIAGRLQVDEPTVSLTAALFFDVAWARGSSDWMVSRVIHPEMFAGAFDLAAKLKLAYFGGPLVARAIFDAPACPTPQGAGQLFTDVVLWYLNLLGSEEPSATVMSQASDAGADDSSVDLEVSDRSVA